MNAFTQWIEDARWSANVRRARRWRRRLTFAQRRRFDEAIKPILDSGSTIAYPDAFYHITIDDLCRAMIVAASQP